MAEENLSCVLAGPGKVAFENRPIPQLEDSHDVRVQIKYTGVCGSDIHFWVHGAIGNSVITTPIVMGHEAVGVIESIGSSVHSLQPGDRVALEPGVPCRRCGHCKKGKYNLCAHIKFAASPPLDGTLTKYYIIPEDFCFKLPDHVSLEEGALVEPLSVAVHIVRQADVRPGDSMIVFGAGPVGLLCGAVAKAFGADKIIAVDINEERLKFAKKYIATSTFMPPSKTPASEVATKLKTEHELGEGADIVLEASGAEASIQTGVHALKMGGTFVQGGMGKDVMFPIITAVCMKELTVKGSFRYGAGDFQLAVQMIASGRISVKELITGIVEFQEAPKAWEDVRSGKGIKTLIRGVD